MWLVGVCSPVAQPFPTAYGIRVDGLDTRTVACNGVPVTGTLTANAATVYAYSVQSFDGDVSIAVTALGGSVGTLASFIDSYPTCIMINGTPQCSAAEFMWSPPVDGVVVVPVRVTPVYA